MLVWIIEVLMLHHTDADHKSQTTLNIQIYVI